MTDASSSPGGRRVPTWPGLWEFPGKREAGESWEECLGRELREELGVEVAVGTLFQEVIHAYPGKQVHLRFFRARVVAGEPRPIGCAAVAWISRASSDGPIPHSLDAGLLARLAAPGDGVEA